MRIQKSIQKGDRNPQQEAGESEEFTVSNRPRGYWVTQ
jgi:hypothetical protein